MLRFSFFNQYIYLLEHETATCLPPANLHATPPFKTLISIHSLTKNTHTHSQSPHYIHTYIYIHIYRYRETKGSIKYGRNLNNIKTLEKTQSLSLYFSVFLFLSILLISTLSSLSLSLFLLTSLFPHLASFVLET